MKKTQSPNVGATYQARAFLVSITILAVVFYIRFHMFVVHDPPAFFKPITSKNDTVTMGMYIRSFSIFDVIKNDFVVEGMVWFAFDSKRVNLTQIEQFDVVHGKIIHKSKPIVHQNAGETLAQFDVRISFNTALDYRLFPIDDHRIKLVITNHFLPQGLLFSSSPNDVTIEKDLYLPGWKIHDYGVQAGLISVDLKRGTQQFTIENPQVVISFDCERTDPNLIVNILLTLILILFMSLLTFSSREDSVLIVSVIIVALIGYRAVMLSMGPPHISYFMLSDYIYIFSITSAVLAILAGIFAYDEHLNVQAKKWFIIGIYAFFVGGCCLMSMIL